MKKIRLLTVFVCYMLLFLSVDARRVDVEKAEKVARSYARTTSQLSVHKDFRLSKTVTKRVIRQRPAVRSANPQQQDEPMFYVFAMNGNGGFIIVSGDDVAKPVLGYSDDGTYDENNPNLAYWMETLSQEITVAVENSAPQDELIKAQWAAFENDEPVRASGDYVAPLVKTKWSQGKPYNNKCPIFLISGTWTYTYTGCVATAMAQIMKYYEYPTTRTVTIPGYKTRTYKFPMSEITGSTTYDWNNMTDTYSSFSMPVENDAVATLMYHCGVSVEMDYDTEVSGAYSSDVADALNTYFGYDAGTVYHYRNYCSYTEWIDLLKTEISAGRPVYYSGRSDEGGHAFVCDGYDSDDLFHFNWGWGGSSDGYFELSALNPGSARIGDGYNQDQSIITGIQPDRGGQPVKTVKLGLSSFWSSKTSLNSPTEPLDVTAGELKNIGTETITNIYLGILLYREDGSYYDYETKKHTLQSFVSGSTYPARTLLSNYSLPSDLPAGTYKLYPAYSVSDGTPSIIPGVNGNKYIIVIVASDGSVTLSASSETFVSAQTPAITAQPQSAIYTFGATATALSVTANVRDGGALSYQWYRNTSDSNAGGSEINGETSASYTPSTATVGTTFYYVKVTNTNTDGSITGLQTASKTSAVAIVTVNIQTPAITAQPQSAIYTVGATATALSVTASVADGGTLSYQWYSNLNDNNTGGVAINNATRANYTPPTDAIITVYYYVKVTNTNNSQTVSAKSNVAVITVMAPVDAQTPAITAHPQSATYTFGATATALSVTASVADGGTLSYQWYRNTSNSNARGTEINGAMSSSYTPSTATVGTTYYYVKVTNTNTDGSITGSQTASRTSNVATVTVNIQTPSITAHPQSAIYTVGATATALSVTANVTDGGRLSYQWYSNTNNSNIGGTKINGAMSSSYMPSTATVGTTYYYAVITNSNTGANIIGSQTASMTSDVAEITVNKASQPVPDAPTLANKTAISVTLTAIPGAEYSMDGNTWQDSTTFDNLIPDTKYTFYARMKETDTHNASRASWYLSVRTDVAEADLLSLTVNGDSISVEGNELGYYQAECDETSVTLGIESSIAASATVTVGNDSINNGIVPLSGDLTVINIKIVSGDIKKTNTYKLTVANPLDAGSVLYQRWNNVVAVNINPANNGGRIIEGIRWYAPLSTNVISSEQFIPVSGGAEDYHAEIMIAGKWHNVCGTPEEHAELVAAYPNPVTIGENLTLRLPKNFMGGYMNVISLSGSMVKHKLPLPDAVNIVSIADWATGIYLLNIVAPNGSQKLVKIIVSN